MGLVSVLPSDAACYRVSIDAMRLVSMACGWSGSGPALGLGHHLGPPTRGRPQILGENLIFKKKKKFGDIGKKKKFYIFPLLLRSPKKLSNTKDNTTLNRWVLQIE